MPLCAALLLTLAPTATAERTWLPPHFFAAGASPERPDGLATGESFAPWNTTVLIKARDGTLLNTYLWLPSSNPTSKIPAIMERTPYGATLLDGAAAGWVTRGYACVWQDMRGRYGSKGNFSFWRYSATDAADTIAWVVSQPWSNGKVATQGGSADGITQYVQPVVPQPNIVAQFVVVASAEIHRTMFQQGGFRESLVVGWLTSILEPQYAAAVEAHEGDGPYWDTIDTSTHYANVHWPAVHAGGWWDIFQQANLDAYEGYRTDADASVRDQQYLVMLPGGHCGSGAIKWENKSWGLTYASTLAAAVTDAAAKPVPPVTATRPSAESMLPWSLADAPKLVWYVMGPGWPAKGNYWTSGDDWPAATVTPYYLSGANKLETKPAGAVPPSVYVYDPVLPIPTVGGGNLLLKPCGPQDQAKVEDRFDVVKFTSDPIVGHVGITGKIKVVLFVSSNVTDTDFVVKVTDVFPSLDDKTPTSMLVQDGIVRMRWRDGPSATSPSPMVPGTVYEVTVSLGPTSYIFDAGHRIRVAVSSSNFPRFSVNPNNGRPLSALPGPPVIAIQTVWHDAVHQSRVELPVVSLDDMPEL